MNLKQLVNRKTFNYVSKFNCRLLPLYPNYDSRKFSTISSFALFSIHSSSFDAQTLFPNSKLIRYVLPFKRFLHSDQRLQLSEISFKPKFGSGDDEEEDETMNEFLSRFVWIMRGKLSEAYPDSGKETIDGMLLIIVEKVVSEIEKGGLEQMLDGMVSAPSQDFSEDLWRTVFEVSNSVLVDMDKERKKEKMKGFLQSEEVKEMCRFAGEIGIRGDMLRELRYKWAREKMEESEFYASLEKLREDKKAQEKEEADGKNAETMMAITGEERANVISLPKRHGKIKYKIYGLNLSDSKWAEVAEKIHEIGDTGLPEEPKPLHGKSKLVTERILSLKEEDDPDPLLAEWMELVEPSKIDWITLLDKLKEQNKHIYFKVAEFVLSEKSFEPNIRDYNMLIDAYSREGHLEDAKRILNKMKENGILPDVIVSTVLVDMYSKAGKFNLAKEAFDSLMNHGFEPDVNVYYTIIMAAVSAGQPRSGELLMNEMKDKGIQPTEEIHMALLRSFSQQGDAGGVIRIANHMHLAGQQNLESYALLIQAYGQKEGGIREARSNFDYMINSGLKPDDRCTASMIAVYAEKNLLDKALQLLLQLEKDGFEPGPATYSVLIDWFGRLMLVDEAEQLLGKIAEQGEVPSIKVHVSLCDMYARAENEKKALQALGVVKARKDELGPDDFQRVIRGLIVGGFPQDAQSVFELMEAQGFKAPEDLQLSLAAGKIMKSQRPWKYV